MIKSLVDLSPKKISDVIYNYFYALIHKRKSRWAESMFLILIVP